MIANPMPREIARAIGGGAAQMKSFGRSAYDERVASILERDQLVSLTEPACSIRYGPSGTPLAAE